MLPGKETDMASASSTTDPKETECPVCHEDFTQPKILPCAHVFCRDCIVKWLQSNVHSQCPLCRCVIVDTKAAPKQTSGEIVDALPTDLAMKTLVESAQTLRKDHVCCGHPETLATSLCLSCSDMLCRSCAIAHGRLTATQHHTVEDLASLTAERLAASRPATCLTHRGELCKLFCNSHGETICHLCANTKHRACPEVMELKEKIQEARGALAELSAALKCREIEVETAISQLNEELVQTEKRTQESLEEIDKTCDQLIKTINTRRRRLKEVQRISNNDSTQNISKKKTDLVGQRGKLTSHSLLVDRIDKTMSPADVQEMRTTLQALVNKLSLTIPVPPSKDVGVIRMVEIDQKAVSSIERDLERLGKLTDSRTVNPPAFCFHANHGKNIVLSDNNQTAK
nr:hypothetical protein BaRGS_016444 [Batillaria attramentaria]